MARVLVWLPLLMMVPLAAGCSQDQGGAPVDLQVHAVKEVPSDAAGVAAEGEGGSQPGNAHIPTATPRIAYSYSVSYRLGNAGIGEAQSAHVALCDKLGAAKCRIKSMQRESSDGEFITATLNLVVDAKLARSFQDQMDKAVDEAGGDLSSRGIEGEDLSKQMVDTEARIKAKSALAERLMGIIQTRSGSVADLVEAENAYAQAQEELEAAKSWMAEMQGRVAMSDIAVSYTSSAPAGSGLWRPIRDAFAEAGQMLGDSVGALIRFVIVLAPWGLAIWGLVWLFRTRGWRIPWPNRWRRSADAQADPVNPDHPA